MSDTPKPTHNTLDNHIDQVLTGLNSVRPDAAMEQRLLRTLETRAAAPASPRLWHWPLAIAAAAAVLVIATLATLKSRPSNFVPVAQNPVAQDPVAQNPVAQANPSIPPIRAPQGSLISTSPNPVHTLKVMSSSPDPVFSPADQQALDDTNAPSLLAPPMPLTHQERLLRRATREGAPTELAELEPLRELALRSALEARQKATVERYIERMLAPIAASETFQPTPPEPKQDPHLAADPN